MLGWMIGRGNNAPDTLGDADTTQIDQPDTPAPVFAARAFKSALFGTPARPNDSRPARAVSDNDDNMKQDSGSQTPQKPQGILMTPGTGTSRKKKVSFGNELARKASNPTVARGTAQRARLGNASTKQETASQKPATQQDNDDLSDDEWEDDGEDLCTHDITVDLNEPHSRSGKYWKGEFAKYHEDAKAEMEKLLKYKQLAKSYAKQKDAEAIELAELLKEEQQKVIVMERRIAEGASQIVSKRGTIDGETSPELLTALTKQTALAVQHRTRVQELEEQLAEFLKDREGDGDFNDRKRRFPPSPRTQNTLLETQRELRKARNQLKDLDHLRDQVATLKSQLKATDKRATKAENEAQANKDATRESSRTQELRAQLREAREESRKKDEELRHLKREFETFRLETQSREEDTKGVLERAHNKITELKKELKSLKMSEPMQPTQPSRPKSWHPSMGTGEPLALDGARPDEKPAPEQRRTNNVIPGRERERRSFDLSDLDEASFEFNAPAANLRSLRQQFNDGAVLKATQSDLGTRIASTNLGERPNLERPRWQPFVPRSPRNRAYLGAEITKQIENGGATALATKPKEIAVPDLPALAKSIATTRRGESAEPVEDKVDLLQDKFARLGNPEGNSTFLENMSKSNLPPERRAAAIARIEQRMAEKKRAQMRKGGDKENVRP